MSSRGSAAGKAHPSRRLEIFVQYNADREAWVAVPLSNGRSSSIPRLIVEQPSTKPPDGSKGRCILLDGDGQKLGDSSGATAVGVDQVHPADGLSQLDRWAREIEVAGQRLGRRYQENVTARSEVEKREEEVGRKQGGLEQQRARLEKDLAETTQRQARSEEELKRRSMDLRNQESRAAGQREELARKAADLEKRQAEVLAIETKCKAEVAELKQEQCILQKKLTDKQLACQKYMEEWQQARLAEAKTKTEAVELTKKHAALEQDFAKEQEEGRTRLEEQREAARAAEARLKEEARATEERLNDEAAKLEQVRARQQEEMEEKLRVSEAKAKLELDKLNQKLADQQREAVLAKEKSRAELMDAQQRLAGLQHKLEQQAQDAERGRMAEAQKARLQEELEKSKEVVQRHREERRRNDEEREKASQDRAKLEEEVQQQTVRLKDEHRKLKKVQEQFSQQSKDFGSLEATSNEHRGRLEVELAQLRDKEAQPGQPVMVRVLDEFDTKRLDTPLTREEEQILKDGHDMKAAVFREQLRRMESALAAATTASAAVQESRRSKADAAKSENAEAQLGASLESVARGTAYALLALEGLRRTDDAKQTEQCEQALVSRVAKAHKLAKNHRSKVPMAFAFATAGACCLSWSSSRRKVEEDAKTVMSDVQELQKWLTDGGKDFKDMRQEFQKKRKSDCLAKLLEVCTKCLHAWSLLEGYLASQRQFLESLRKRQEPHDLRMLLFATLSRATPDELVSARLELAALIKVSARTRRDKRPMEKTPKSALRVLGRTASLPEVKDAKAGPAAEPAGAASAVAVATGEEKAADAASAVAAAVGEEEEKGELAKAGGAEDGEQEEAPLVAEDPTDTGGEAPLVAEEEPAEPPEKRLRSSA